MVRACALCDDGSTMTSEPGLGYVPRRAARSADERLLGGVAAGVAEHLGVPVNWVRGFFLVTTALAGLGVVLYAGLWLTLPLASRLDTAAPGLESAARLGKRPGRPPRFQDIGSLIALGAIALGIIAVGHMLWSGSYVF